MALFFNSSILTFKDEFSCDDVQKSKHDFIIELYTIPSGAKNLINAYHDDDIGVLLYENRTHNVKIIKLTLTMTICVHIELYLHEIPDCTVKVRYST